MSENVYTSEHLCCMSSFIDDYSRIFHLKYYKEYKIKIDAQSTSKEEGTFMSNDFPYATIRFVVKRDNEEIFHGCYNIRTYPNCCGVAVIYGYYDCSAYKLKRSKLGIKLFSIFRDFILGTIAPETCSDLGFGSCQYICTDHQGHIKDALDNSDFVLINTSFGRFDHNQEYDEIEYLENRMIYLYNKNLILHKND